MEEPKDNKEPLKGELRMINIESMIDVLTMLWNKGVDYVDISGEQGPDHDEICFSFCREYMDKESADSFEEEFDEEEKTPKITVKLTDKDIDDLI